MVDPTGADRELMGITNALTGTVLAFAFAAHPALSLAKATPHAVVEATTTDSLLNRVFEEIGRQRFDLALNHVEALIRVKPNFRLAHLIKGDLLLARARPLATMGNAPNAPAGRMEDLRDEAIARLNAYRNRPAVDRMPRYLLQLRPEQKYAVVVDTRRSRLYVYQNENERPRFVADYYISSGKKGSQKVREGDQKTPVGVYHVTASLPRQKLTDFYGHGAYPINYPNEWDRRQGRNGHGIWLHGTPSDTYSRPPRASDGCVVLANTDLDVLGRYLQIGLTPVIISEEIEWLELDDWDRERRQFREQLEKWRGDWESRDTDKYLSHYSKKFTAGKQDLDTWAKQKRQVNNSKSWVKVGISNLSMFRNPGKEDLVVVTFDQEYRSNNLSNTMKKRQYWVKDEGRWRIVFEGT
jgi:murein L,D-transpeptidase YafK